MNCLNRGSRVCDRELQKQEAAANAIPPGQGRREAMEAILDLAYERVYFIPFFQARTLASPRYTWVISGMDGAWEKKFSLGR